MASQPLRAALDTPRLSSPKNQSPTSLCSSSSATLIKFALHGCAAVALLKSLGMTPNECKHEETSSMGTASKRMSSLISVTSANACGRFEMAGWGRAV
eukprot:5072450-Amphidinium_carterae.2